MSDKSILQLNIKREFFEKIALGAKKEEYRERKQYWDRRLHGREYETIIFRNGYGLRVPEMEVEFNGVRKATRRGSAIYAIKLGRVLSVKRWRGPIEK